MIPKLREEPIDIGGRNVVVDVELIAEMRDKRVTTRPVDEQWPESRAGSVDGDIEGPPQIQGDDLALDFSPLERTRSQA